jgi:hypothetical protein
VVDLSLFLNLVDGIRRTLVQDSMGTSSGQRATTTCALMLAVGMFIDSQSLIYDDASLNLAIVEARHLFKSSSRRRRSLAATASFGECRKL